MTMHRDANKSPLEPGLYIDGNALVQVRSREEGFEAEYFLNGAVVEAKRLDCHSSKCLRPMNDATERLQILRAEAKFIERGLAEQVYTNPRRDAEQEPAMLHLLFGVPMP